MEAREKLIKRLRERQGSRGQNDFAVFLGISPGMLSRLYKGDRNVGLDTLVCVAERYPELGYLFLTEAVASSQQTQVVEPTSPLDSPQAHGDAL